MNVVRNNWRGDGEGWWLEAVVGDNAGECDEILHGTLRQVPIGKPLGCDVHVSLSLLW